MATPSILLCPVEKKLTKQRMQEDEGINGLRIDGKEGHLPDTPINILSSVILLLRCLPLYEQLTHSSFLSTHGGER